MEDIVQAAPKAIGEGGESWVFAFFILLISTKQSRPRHFRLQHFPNYVAIRERVEISSEYNGISSCFIGQITHTVQIILGLF